MRSLGDFRYLKIKEKENICLLTLARPEKANIFNLDVWEEMRACLGIIESDHSLRAVLINAEGKNFSGGIEFQSLMQADSYFIRKNLSVIQSTYYKWEELDIPVVAAIHGKCLGSAAELIISCDLRVASKDAFIAFPEVPIGGLAPDMGGLAKLTRLVGLGQSKRLILTGEMIDAAEAKAIGLIEYLVEPEDLFDEAWKICQNIASMPEAAVFMAKKGLNLAAESSLQACRIFEQVQSVYCCGTSDQKELMTALYEKREPRLTGK